MKRKQLVFWVLTVLLAANLAFIWGNSALPGEASREIAAQIPGAALHIYPQWGHGLYEEAKDFNDLILSFLKAPII